METAPAWEMSGEPLSARMGRAGRNVVGASESQRSRTQGLLGAARRSRGLLC